MKLKHLAIVILGMSFNLAVFADDSFELAQNSMQIDGVNARGEPQTTVIDANGNLKIVNPPARETRESDTFDAPPAIQPPVSNQPIQPIQPNQPLNEQAPAHQNQPGQNPPLTNEQNMPAQSAIPAANQAISPSLQPVPNQPMVEQNRPLPPVTTPQSDASQPMQNSNPTNNQPGTQNKTNQLGITY